MPRSGNAPKRGQKKVQVQRPRSVQYQTKDGRTETVDRAAAVAKKFLPGAAHDIVDLGRSAFRNVFGFDERHVHAGGGGAGQTVEVESAPVAFPRRPVGVVSRLYSERGRDFLHVHDLIQNVKIPGNAATGYYAELGSASSTGTLNPSNTGTFPQTSSMAAIFHRYRPLKACLHYEHYASTSTQCQVEIGWTPDIDESFPGSTAEFAAYENIVFGSCYEDFSLEVDPKALARFPWMYVLDTDEVEGRTSDAGYFMVAVDNYTPTAAMAPDIPVGNIWVEAIFELTDIKPQSDVAISLLRAEQMLLSSKTTKEERDEIIRLILQRTRVHLESLEKKKRTERSLQQRLLPSEPIVISKDEEPVQIQVQMAALPSTPLPKKK